MLFQFDKRKKNLSTGDYSTQSMNNALTRTDKKNGMIKLDK